MKEAIASQLKNLQMRKPRDFVPHNYAEQKEPTETRIELAKIAGVSHGTIDKVEAIKESAIPSVYVFQPNSAFSKAFNHFPLESNIA